MNTKPRWANLTQRKCPKCSASLKVHESEKFPNDTMHTCTNCDFRVRNSRMEQIVLGMRVNRFKPYNTNPNKIEEIIIE